MVTSLREARWMAWVLACHSIGINPLANVFGLAANMLRDLCDLIEDAEWISSPYGDGEECPFCGASGYDYLEDGKHDEDHRNYCVFRHDRKTQDKAIPESLWILMRNVLDNNEQ